MKRRLIIQIRGTVQGVGFRPFVFGLAAELDLVGFVRNQMGEVHIEVEGESSKLDEFSRRVRTDAPPMAIIDAIETDEMYPHSDREFRIELSADSGSGPIVISADLATCDDCLRELFDPADRRFRYPFLNCTNCGPRLTIVTGAPYDRQRTTMAGFQMCAQCGAEYEDPKNRRFHAQPTACPICGPNLATSTLDQFEAAIRDGKIGAMKGLGGYHLVCDARNAQAVALLRKRKHRDEKPFAIMVADAATARQFCEINTAELDLLQSRRRPIVLLRKKRSSELAETIAPGNPFLGLILPYTPLHHLLLHDLHFPLVMTSGNRSDEPIAYDDEDAIERLSEIADIFLTHNRPIHVRCDDSVTRIVLSEDSPLRRSRGYAPQPIALSFDCRNPILATGGQLKSTFAFGRGNQAIISHHLGDLDHHPALLAFERDLKLYRELFDFAPKAIAHDLHPDYASTRHAMALANELNATTIAVQHHHAHLASCMAEHGLSGEAIGVIFDGTGLGADATIWGGEFLVGGYKSFRRAANLRPVPMPGGEQAIHEPWRMAASHLLDAGCECRSVQKRIDAASWKTITQMIQKKFNSPPTSSAGRLFDAVASLAGVRDRTTYEGQAAIELEWAAALYSDASGFSPSPGTPGEGRGGGLIAPIRELAPTLTLPRRTRGGDEEIADIYPFDLHETNSDFPLEIDTRLLIRTIAKDADAQIPAGIIASRFHHTVATMIESVCIRLRKSTGLNTIALSGGVFMNRLLTEAASHRLTAAGFMVYRQRLVPPNDGGLSLGQLAVAAAAASV